MAQGSDSKVYCMRRKKLQALQKLQAGQFILGDRALFNLNHVGNKAMSLETISAVAPTPPQEIP